MRLKAEYASREDLGRDILAQRPDLQGKTPLEVADKLLASPYGSQIRVGTPETGRTWGNEEGQPSGYLDISPLRALGNIPGDALKTMGENVSGLVEMLTNSPITQASDLAETAAGGVNALVKDAGLPFGVLPARPQYEEAARSLGRGFLDSLSPQGLEERPVRAAANVASGVSPRSILAALGKANTAGRVGRGVMMAENVVNNPVGAGIGGVASAARGTGRMMQRGYQRLSRATTGEAAGLGKDVRDSMAGFTTGTGPRAIRDLVDRVAADPVSSPVFENYRNAARAGSGKAFVAQQDIATETLKGVDNMQSETNRIHGQYLDNATELDKPLDQAIVLKGNQPVRLVENLRSSLEGNLDGHGVRLVQKGGQGPTPAPNPRIQAIWDQAYHGVTDAQDWNRISAQLKAQGLPVPDFPEPPHWVVEWNDAYADLPEGRNRQVIERAVEKLANQDESQPIRALHMDRRELDKIIAPLDEESPVRPILTTIRATLGQTLREFIQDPDFAREMLRYEQQQAVIDQIRQVFKLPEQRVISRSGVVHHGQWNQEETLSALKDAYSDTERKHGRPVLLEILEREGGARNLRAKILGYNYEGIMGRGFLAKGQVSGEMRSLGTAAVAGMFGQMALGIPAVIGAAATAIPAAIFYSPRFASSLFLKLGEMSRTPPNPGKVRRAAAAMQQRGKALLNHPVAGPYVRAAMREGWSMAKLFETLQQQGIDVDQIIRPEQQTRKRPLLRQLSTAGVPYHGQLRSR